MNKILALILNLTFLFFISNAQNLPSYIPSNGLVSWWPFSGNVIDSSGNGNNGTVYNSTLTNDRFGSPSKAYSFNGVNSYIEVPNSASLSVTSTYSISFWFKAAQWSFQSPIDEHALVSKIADGNWYGGYEIRLGGTAGGVHHTGNINGNFYIGALGADTGIWYNVISTYDGSNIRFFLNGVLRDSFSTSGSIQTSSNPLRFGRRGGAGYYNCWYNGTIDDVAIWNRSLSNQEISAIFNFNTLPVKLKNFQLNSRSNCLKLEWSTTSELNNKGFYIERSLDSEHWNSISFIKGKGNSNIISNYSFTDNSIFAQETKAIYYRLLQIDFDGKKEYSKVVSYRPSVEKNISVFPNPFNNALSIEGDFNTDESIDISISNITGVKLYSSNQNIQLGMTKIDVGNLEELLPGIYFLSVKTSKINLVQKVIKL